MGALVTKTLPAGASTDEVAPCGGVTGEIGWLQGGGIGKSLSAIHFDLIIYGCREVDCERQFGIVCFWAPLANGRISHFIAKMQPSRRA